MRAALPPQHIRDIDTRYAEDKFKRSKLTVLKNYRVTKVNADSVECTCKKSGAKLVLDTGACVWATGIAPRPFTRKLIRRLGKEFQFNKNGLVVDETLKVQTLHRLT